MKEMKKLLFTAIAAMVLTSCSKIEDIIDPDVTFCDCTITLLTPDKGAPVWSNTYVGNCKEVETKKLDELAIQFNHNYNVQLSSNEWLDYLTLKETCETI